MEQTKDIKDTKEEIKAPATEGAEVKAPAEEKPKEEPKKEEKEEKPKSPEKGEEVKVDIEKLKLEIQEKAQKISELETASTKVDTLTAEVEAHKSKVTEYEELLTKLIETKMSQVPEEFKDLIPDSMEIKQKLSWLEKAEAKGIFNKKEIKKPNVEVGKPLNVETPQVDSSKMSAMDLMKTAFSSVRR